MKKQDDGVDVVSDSIVITDPYINGPLIDAFRPIIEWRSVRGNQKDFAERTFKNPPFIKMGGYVQRRGLGVADSWTTILDMLYQAERPLYLSEGDLKERPTVVMEKLMQLAPDDMLLYCIILAYFYAPSFEKATAFLSEVSNIWTLKPFEERLFESLEELFDIQDLSDAEDSIVLLAPALAVGLVEIRED